MGQEVGSVDLRAELYFLSLCYLILTGCQHTVAFSAGAFNETLVAIAKGRI